MGGHLNDPPAGSYLAAACWLHEAIAHAVYEGGPPGSHAAAFSEAYRASSLRGMRELAADSLREKLRPTPSQEEAVAEIASRYGFDLHTGCFECACSIPQPYAGDGWRLRRDPAADTAIGAVINALIERSASAG